MCPKCSSPDVTRNETGENVCAKCGHTFDDIAFDCPGCHKTLSGPAELINIQMDCPECGYSFKPVPKSASGPQTTAGSRPDPELEQRIADIRRKAKGLASLAGAMFLIAALKFIVGLSDLNSGSLGTIICLVLGILFFIASQAMYMRANTEK